MMIRLQEFRNEGGRRIYYQGHVKRISENVFKVHSESFNVEYDVEIVDGQHFYCSCPDFEKRSKFLDCKHIVAVRCYINNSIKIGGMIIYGNK